MAPVVWFLIVNTLVVSLALGLAAAAWVKVGTYMQTCRCTVQAYAHALEDTQPHPIVDDEPEWFEHPSGRHARVEPTEVLPATGELDSRDARYHVASGGAVW